MDMDKRKLSDNELNKVAGGGCEFGGEFFKPSRGEGMIPCETCGFMNYPEFSACTYCGALLPSLPRSEE